MTTNGSRLWADSLTKVYKGRKVVNDVNISVEQGEVVGLLGPNGAGKTTTFYMMVGLIPPAAGSVHLDDEDLTRTPMFRRARKGIGYLAQEPSVFRKLSVEDNVLAILETLGLPKKERKARLDELLRAPLQRHAVDAAGVLEAADVLGQAEDGGPLRRVVTPNALEDRSPELNGHREQVQLCVLPGDELPFLPDDVGSDERCCAHGCSLWSSRSGP